MMQLLIKYGNIVLTTTIGRRVRYHLCQLLRVRVGGYIVNLLDFYSYRLIGKLTAFLKLQEFSQRNQSVSFTFAARLSFNSSKVKLTWLSLKQQPCLDLATAAPNFRLIRKTSVLSSRLPFFDLRFKKTETAKVEESSTGRLR